MVLDLEGRELVLPLVEVGMALLLEEDNRLVGSGSLS